MSWSSPATAVAGTVLTAAFMNTNYGDNLSILTPTGNVIWRGGTSAPTGTFICDGTAYSQGTYSALYDAYGVGDWPFGTSGSNFNVPDLIGRTPIGYDSAAIRISGFTTVGSSGGAGTHTMTVGELVSHSHSHSHSMSARQSSGGTSGNSGPGNVNNPDTSFSTGADATTAGSSTPFSLMQPSLAGVWIIYQ